MMLSSTSAALSRMHSGRAIAGVLRQKFFMSVVMNLAPVVEMVLLNDNLTVSMSAVGVPQSPGQLMRWPPAVSWW